MEEEAGIKEEVTEKEDRNGKEEVFTKIVRAGKRTYFFDVKVTRSDDYYLTITESKKRLGKEGKVFYEKHKIFLYKEDFEKFKAGLHAVLHFIETGEEPVDTDLSGVFDHVGDNDIHSDLDFEDLGSHEEEDKDK